MLTLLFIEDEPDAVEPVMDALKADCECYVHTFEEADAKLMELMPDIVILDILKSGSTAEPEPTGKGTFDSIWNKRFCPIVVYSAQPEVLSETTGEHPFVRFVQKGSGSDEQIKTSLAELRPHVESVRDAEIQIRTEYSQALREVAPDAFRHFENAEDRKNATLRSAQRRLAAWMDDRSRHDEALQAWEQYLCPPISDNVTLGDILQTEDGDPDDASSFRLVLTPSCDLVATGGRSAKVADVLVACCEPVKTGIEATALKGISKSKLKGRLQSNLLTPGFLDGIIPLPKLEGRIPPMAANLKKLRLLPLSHVTSGTAAYKRVASIDSPFRELVSWAYSQTACRPGLPDRDFDAWRDEIIDACDQHDGDES